MLQYGHVSHYNLRKKNLSSEKSRKKFYFVLHALIQASFQQEVYNNSYFTLHGMAIITSTRKYTIHFI